MVMIQSPSSIPDHKVKRARKPSVGSSPRRSHGVEGAGQPRVGGRRVRGGRGFRGAAAAVG